MWPWKALQRTFGPVLLKLYHAPKSRGNLIKMLILSQLFWGKCESAFLAYFLMMPLLAGGHTLCSMDLDYAVFFSRSRN